MKAEERLKELVKCDYGDRCVSKHCDHRKVHTERKACCDVDIVCTRQPASRCVEAEYAEIDPRHIKALKNSIALGIGIVITIVLLLTIGVLAGCSTGEPMPPPTEKQTLTIQEQSPFEYDVLWSKSIYALEEVELRWMVEYSRRRGAPQEIRYQDYAPSRIAWSTTAQVYQLELNRRWAGFYTDLRGSREIGGK